METKKAELADEIADTMIHSLNFADRARINVLDALEAKIAKNDVNDPVEASRNSPKKRSLR